MDITAELSSARQDIKKAWLCSGKYRCPSEVDNPLMRFDIAKLQKFFELPNKMAEKITSLLQFSASVDCQLKPEHSAELCDKVDSCTLEAFLHIEDIRLINARKPCELTY